MSDQTVNGWKNYNTWQLNVYISQNAVYISQLNEFAIEAYKIAKATETLSKGWNACFIMEATLKHWLSKQIGFQTGIAKSFMQNVLAEIDYQALVIRIYADLIYNGELTDFDKSDDFFTSNVSLD